jgi:uncharacterized protein YfaT (DUF1175 family)
MRPLLRPEAMIALVLVCGAWGLVRIANTASSPSGEVRAAEVNSGLSPGNALATVVGRDSLRDGFPDTARIVRPEDRATFVSWLTYLAESQYYFPSPEASSEIRDCAGLIRFAFRNALMAHDAAWRRRVLPEKAATTTTFGGEPDFGDLQEFTYPNWVLGTDLFRTRAGPLAPGDLRDGAFAQFADVGTLLHYNTFFVSRDIRAARPGDLLFYYQPGQSETYHSMLFVGRSYFQPEAADWLVYHTGDINGAPGQIRELEVRSLVRHPDPRWRPLAANPRFLGVYRFELLR